MDNVFPPDDLWFGSYTYTNYAVLYDLYLDVLMWFVYRCLNDGERDGLRWPALSRNWLSCTRCWLYLLTMKWVMWRTLFLHISHSLGCFCPRTIFTKKRIGQVTSDLLYMRFTYYTKNNQQGCSGLSNCFSLCCLRPLMNQLPPVRWSRIGFYPSALRAGGVLLSRCGQVHGRAGGRAGSCQTCRTHISNCLTDFLRSKFCGIV